MVVPPHEIKKWEKMLSSIGVTFDLVDIDEAEHADKLDGDPRAGDLREEDKGRRGQVVHRELVDDEPARIEEV